MVLLHDVPEIPSELKLSVLHPSEQALLALIRAVKHGTLADVKIADGLPVLIEAVYVKIKLV